MAINARWMAGTLAGAALLLGSAAPAQARGGPRYHPGWDRGWHHRHDGGFGVGDAIGVAALVGAAAIVASSLSKDRQARGRAPQDPPPPPDDGTDYGADMRHVPPVADEADFSDVADANARDDAMTDACAQAARDEAQRDYAGHAEIRQIDPPRATPRGGFNIDGVVENGAGDRTIGVVAHRFTCAMQDGRVGQVYLSRDVATR